MSEHVTSILLSGKDATADAFSRVKSGIKDMATDTERATSGIRAAQMAVAQAMRGDLVGAAKSATHAFNQLWTVMLKNPYTAIAAAVVGAGLAIYKLIEYHRNAAEEARKHQQAIQDLNAEISAIGGHAPGDVRRELAKSMVESGDRAGLEKRRDDSFVAATAAEEQARKYAEMAENNKSLGWATGKKNQAQLDAYAKQAKDTYSELKAAADIYSAAIAELDAAQAKQASNEIDRLAKEEEARKKQLSDEMKAWASGVLDDVQKQEAGQRWLQDEKLRIAKETEEAKVAAAKKAADEKDKREKESIAKQRTAAAESESIFSESEKKKTHVFAKSLKERTADRLTARADGSLSGLAGDAWVSASQMISRSQARIDAMRAGTLSQLSLNQASSAFTTAAERNKAGKATAEADAKMGTNVNSMASNVEKIAGILEESLKPA